MAIRLTVDDNTSAVLTLGANDETTLSADTATVVTVDNYNDLRNKPQIEGVELVGDKSLNDLGAYTDDQVDTLLLAKADRSDIPSLDGYATEQWVENKHYLTTETDPVFKASVAYSITASDVSNWNNKSDFSGNYNDLTNKPTIPSKTSQLTNDSGFITDAGVTSWNNQTGAVTFTETDPTVPAWAKAPNKPSYTASEVGAVPTSRKVNNKALSSDITLNASDVGALSSDTVIPSKTSDLTNDSGYITGMEILSYGSSTWQNFIDAYTAKKVVYCRASSNANPASGSQTRLAFMAYVNNATSPTSVEFQYYRSVSSHSASQQGDQVFVYTLTSAGVWSVTTREASSKVAAGTGLSSSYASGTITLNLDATIPTKTSDLTNDSGFLTDAVTTFNGQSGAVTYSAPVSSVNGQTGAVSLSIPSKTSDLTNDSGFVNASGASAAAPVQSVNGDTGTVVLDADDVGALPTTEKSVLFYGQVDSTSTATVFTAQIDGITEYFDGLTVMLKNGVVTSASGFTININGLGAKHAYSNMAAATAETTLFNINYTMMFTYDSTRVEGGGWICYRGYNSDNNTIGYQLRTNSMTMPMKSATWRYRLLFTSADGEHFVPANNSNSTNAATAKAVCQDAIDPFGDIRYYGTTASVAANSRPSATALWEQYAIALGYSFNRTGAALTLTAWKPVYVKCAPQSDGSAIIDSTTPYVQDLPTTEDGKIYIYLGVAYSATNIELVPHHPVYWYKDGQIRPYTNAVSGGGGLLVTVTEDGEGTYTANKTAGEIKNVLDVGGSVVIKIGYNYEPLTGAEIQSNRYDFYSKSFPHNPLTCNSLDDYPSHYSDN